MHGATAPHKPDTDYVVVKVINKGRRPVTIGSVGFITKSKIEKDAIINDSLIGGSRELAEGKSTSYLMEQAAIDLDKIKYFVAYDLISTPKVTLLQKEKLLMKTQKKVFENAPLDGVGSQSWRLLWEQARTYSEAAAYKDIPFPNIIEGSRCVLCHELLPLEARDRFISFEEFVKGELQKQANEAERQLKLIKDDLEGILPVEELALRMDSAGITADAERNEISIFHSTIG